MSDLGRGSRMLVTGGAGFIGVHTVRALAAAGHRVLVVDDGRHACGADLPVEVELLAADVGSALAAAAIARFRPEAAVHLAAQGGVSRSMRDPAGDAEANVVATVALLKACAEAAVGRVVFASSGGAVYGQAAVLPSPESTPARPLSPYGAAKLACEGYLGMYERTFGLSSVALRFANVYGPHQDGTGEAGVVAITATRLRAGRRPVIRGDGEQTRDFVYVGDVVEAILLALRSEVAGPVNVGSGAEASINEVVAALSQLAGSDAAPVLSAAREGEVRRACLDAARASTDLGWSATTGLAQGLRATYQSFAGEADGSPRRRPPEPVPEREGIRSR